MKIRLVFFAGLGLMVVLALWFSAAVQAATPGQVQQIASPTPGPDGRILYTVKEGDNCIQISLLFGVSVDYIRGTNNLGENCTLRAGQQIMLGVGGPAAVSPTPGPSPTSTLILPTPTPGAGGSAEVCVLVYGDINGDGLRQETEAAVAGSALSLTSLTGSYSQQMTTVLQSDPNAFQGVCFANVPEGKYTVSAAVPDGYNPTTDTTFTLEAVRPGDISYVDFGAQLKTSSADQNNGGGRSPILGVLGMIFLLLGIGLGVYVWRIMRR